MNKQTMTAYHIILEPSDVPGIWTASVPAFRFTTEGRGRSGAQRAALAAIEGYIEVATELRKPIPPSDVIQVRLPSRSTSKVVSRKSASRGVTRRSRART